MAVSGLPRAKHPAPSLQKALSQQFRADQATAGNAAALAAGKLWTHGFSIKNARSSWAVIRPAIEKICQKYYAGCQLKGQGYYNACRLSAGLGPLPSYVHVHVPLMKMRLDKTIDPCGLGAFLHQVKQGAQMMDAFHSGHDSLEQSVQALVMSGGRDWIAAAAKADPESEGVRRVTGGTCDYCDDLASQGVTVAESGWHNDCVVGDSEVSGVGILSVFDRDFKGDIVIIRTASGKQVRATRNHPVLTDRGWVAAGRLYEGCRVVGSKSGKLEGITSDSYNQETPALIKDIAVSFKVDNLKTAEMPVSAEDFHGDGAGSEICIVRSNGGLATEQDTSFCEHCCEILFKDPTVPVTSSLLASGSGASTFPGLDTSPDSLMRSRSDGMVLFRGPVGSRDDILLGLASEVNSVAQEQASYAITADTKAIGYWEDSFTRFVPGNDFFLDDVIETRIVGFTGHVYNLNTHSNWYLTDSIVTHNCQCTNEPTFNGDTGPSPSLPESSVTATPSEDVDDSLDDITPSDSNAGAGFTPAQMMKILGIKPISPNKGQQ